MTSPNANSRPLFEQVADSLRNKIERGELKPGEQLPSEADLQKVHGISRDTVRRALIKLTQEGLITGGQGRPRHVRSYRPLHWSLSGFESQSNHLAGSDAWSTEVTRQGRTPSETIEIGIEIATGRVAERLNLKADSDLTVVRKRVRYVDDVPFQIADSYFPEELVRGTSLMEPRSVSVGGGVLASIGRPQTRIVDEIAIRMPTGDEIDRLDLPAGTPVAEVVRTGYDADGEPLRSMVTIVPGDRHVLRYELDAS